MKKTSIKERLLSQQKKQKKEFNFSFFGLLTLLGDHPVTIALIYGLMLYFLPPFGWIVMVAVMGSVFAHEAGHFIAAKLNGAPVTVFSVGLPSNWTLALGSYDGTTFQITPYWFLGGYIDPDMRGLPYWRMVIIMLAGVTVNLLLAFLLFASAYLWTGRAEFVGERTVITELSDKVANAKIAGLAVGDEIIRVDETWMENRQQFAATLQTKKGQLVTLETYRGDHRYENIRVLVNEDARIGVGLGGSVQRQPTFSETLAMATRQTAGTIFRTGNKLLELSRIVEPESKDPDKNRMHGIVAVVDVGTAALSHGLGYFLFVVASVNSSLFFVNLVPLPILDGGQIIMLGIQKWRDRAFNPNMEAVITKVCIYFFVALMLLSLYNDIVHRIKF